MKSILFIFIVIGLFNSNSLFAQDNTTSTEAPESNYETGVVTRGVSISIIKDVTKGKSKIRASNGVVESSGSSESTDQEIGLGVGYDYIRINKIGFSAQGIYNTYDGDMALLRASGNATFGVDKNIYLYGGLNISMLNGDDDEDGLSIDYNPGLGIQTGVGFQFTKNIGLNLGYAYLKNEIEVKDFFFGDSADVDVTISGLELALKATF